MLECGPVNLECGNVPAWHFWSFEEGGDGLSLCWAGTLTGPGDTQQDPVPGCVLITSLATG